MLADLSLNGVAYIASLSLNIFLVMLLFWQAKYLIRKINDVQEQESSSRLKLKREVRTVARGAYGVGKRVIQLESTVRRSFDKLTQEMPKKGIHDPNNTAISNLDEAEVLFQQGFDANSVAQRCGLSRSEASLMALIRGHSEEEEAV